MAIWQAAFHLVSTEKTLNLSDPVFISSLQELDKVLPEEKSWCKTIKQYGDIDSTCIEIDISKEKIAEISLRIDLTSISRHQLQMICEFANKNCLLVKYDDALFEANIDSFVDIFKKSDAHRFLTDPKKFLEQLS